MILVSILVKKQRKNGSYSIRTRTMNCKKKATTKEKCKNMECNQADEKIK